MDEFEYPDVDDNRDDTGGSWETLHAYLDESSQRREDRIRQTLERVEEQLEQRDELHAEMLERLQQRIDQYASELQAAYSRPFGGSDETRTNLKETLSELYTKLRQVNRRHWQDRQRLEQERRELLRELDEIESEPSAEEFL